MLKGKIKEGSILIDDCRLLYKVIGVEKNYVVVEPIDNDSNLSCEIMTYQAMENEGWYLPNIK